MTRWQTGRFSYLFLASLLFSVFGAIFWADSAKADSIEIGNPTITYTRSYSTANTYPTVVTDSHTVSIPVTILGAQNSFLYGFNLYTEVSGDFKAFTSITGGFTVSAPYSAGGDMATGRLIVETTAGLVEVSCPIYQNTIDNYNTSGYVVYYCPVTHIAQGATITALNYRVGNYAFGSDGTGWVPLWATSTSGVPIQLQAAWATINTENDASTDQVVTNLDVLNQTVQDASHDIQTKIDEQIDTINDNTEAVEDLKESITDDNIDTDDIDYNQITDAVPAFGPIATIINNLIEFPRVFLTDTPCSPLQIPLPAYLGAGNMTLPLACPSTIMQPYWDLVVFVETLTASYLFFRLAIYIARKIKGLRDPENDDEEYLDL